MERALHDPVQGYYARKIRGIGRRGDFTTAPMLSGLPARAIANWALHAMRETGCRHLIEIGPGEGRLSAAVLAALPWHVRWKTRLHLVERSPALAEIQRKTVGTKATWHPDPASALRACAGRAVIFSNELVDAFPVRRFENTPDGWMEIMVGTDTAGKPHESLAKCDPLPESSAFSNNHPPGQRVEVHESYHSWLREWMPHWRAGRMLTIDYGATADHLYHRRPQGSLRGYRMHQLVTGMDIYQNIGRQDLTADVNFNDLIAWSAPWTDPPELCTFGEFLTQHAPVTTATDRQLADPAGAGGAFLVLDQRCKE